MIGARATEAGCGAAAALLARLVPLKPHRLADLHCTPLNPFPDPLCLSSAAALLAPAWAAALVAAACAAALVPTARRAAANERTRTRMHGTIHRARSQVAAASEPVGAPKAFAGTWIKARREGERAPLSSASGGSWVGTCPAALRTAAPPPTPISSRTAPHRTPWIPPWTRWRSTPWCAARCA